MSFAANTGKISVETANLREEANADSKILEQLSINQEVEILEKSGEWYKVKYNKITGFLREDLLTVNGEIANKETNTASTDNEQAQNQTEEQQAQKPEEQPENTKKEIQKGTYIVSENTKLKIVPSINATDIVEVKKDEEVNVTEIINGWGMC